MEKASKDCRPGSGELRVATWNIHDAKGTDGLRSLERILRVLERIDAAVVGLQEIGCGRGDCDVAQLAKQLGYHWSAIPTVGHRDTRGRGNAILSKLPIEEVRAHDLSHGNHEPRMALEAQLAWGSARLRVLVTHLGLHAGERRYQVTRLLGSFLLSEPATTILLGDINEWWMWGRPLRWLNRHFGNSPAVRTFPSWAPILALDRIWVHPQHALIQLTTPRHTKLAHASDHLPVVACVRMG